MCKSTDPLMPTKLLLNVHIHIMYYFKVFVWTCSAPFLLKDDTHCIRRLISSATDSTIFERTRETKSLEMVNT